MRRYNQSVCGMAVEPSEARRRPSPPSSFLKPFRIYENLRSAVSRGVRPRNSSVYEVRRERNAGHKVR